jgi:hypothetical protein
MNERTQAVSPPARVLPFELAGKDADAAIPGLRAHLDGCPACREEHASLLALVGGEQAP